MILVLFHRAAIPGLHAEIILCTKISLNSFKNVTVTFIKLKVQKRSQITEHSLTQRRLWEMGGGYRKVIQIQTTRRRVWEGDQ